MTKPTDVSVMDTFSEDYALNFIKGYLRHSKLEDNYFSNNTIKNLVDKAKTHNDHYKLAKDIRHAIAHEGISISQ